MQVTVIETVRFVAVSEKVPELVEWLPSPPYEPVIVIVPSLPALGV